MNNKIGRITFDKPAIGYIKEAVPKINKVFAMQDPIALPKIIFP